MKRTTLDSKLLLVFLGLGLGGVGCSLTATRPIQEMANADVAIKAAKDLNADSLVPDIFRSANEAYYRAKRDFRLKDFDNARLHALKATRLAEQAEFEAYRLGGATPEAATRNSFEGAYPDPDASLRENPPSADADLPPPTKSESKSGTAKEEGVSYDDYVKQREAEQQAAEKEKKDKEEDKKKDDKKPSGPSGPPGTATRPLGVPVPDRVSIQSQSLPPPQSAGAPQGVASNEQQDLRPKEGSPKPQAFYEGAKEVSPQIQPLEPSPMATLDNERLHDALEDGPPKKEGFDELTPDPMPPTVDNPSGGLPPILPTNKEKGQ